MEFLVQINGGEEQPFETRHSQYTLAALAAVGKFDCALPCRIKIWVPELVPEYGPYTYQFDATGKQFHVFANDAGDETHVAV